MNTYLKLLFVLLSVVVFSCTSEDGITGEWDLKSLDYNVTSTITTTLPPNAITTLTDGIAMDIDATYTFADGTYKTEGSYTIDGTQSVAGVTQPYTLPVPDIMGSGTFTITDGMITLTASDGNVETYEIVEQTENNLTLSGINSTIDDLGAFKTETISDFTLKFTR